MSGLTKTQKIVWKSAKDQSLLCSWEIGGALVQIHAYMINAEQTDELIRALNEAIDLMAKASDRLASLVPAQRRD